ncbi:MAG TPA: response regulator [Ramlibacter sp.]
MSSSAPTTPTPANRTVLLVEDNLDDVLLTRRAFRKAGLASALQVAGDGDEAVAYLAGDGAFADRQAHPLPSLVLLDWKLPRRSGREVLQWVRAQERFTGLPVVVLTSSREQEDIDQAYSAGANSYIQKPVLLEKLAELSERLHAYWLETNVVSSRSRP